MNKKHIIESLLLLLGIVTIHIINIVETGESMGVFSSICLGFLMGYFYINNFLKEN